MSRKTIHVMNTTFRDGFQSAFGARVLTHDFIPAIQACRDAGMTHFESGGGATFQSLLFYCRENAFAMMDRFRKVVGPEAELQTLARGINVVGLDSQPRDIIQLHAKLFKKHGVTTIRNFDALNDVNNLIYSGQCIHEAGLKHEIVVTLMELPPGCNGAHTVEFYQNCLTEILQAGIPFNSVCFKDASGTATPHKVHDTIRMAKRLLPEDIKCVFHTHETAGCGTLCYKAAIEAGVDQVDLSMAPISGGTCQPDIATLWHALRGTNYELDVDIDKVLIAEKVLGECLADYFMPPEAKAVEPLIPWAPMPGGALTANTQMLRDNHQMDKYMDCIRAMGDVVRRGGYGTSVTPVSQFYFQQAFNNVMFGPWKKIAEGYGKMVLGYFGKTPVPADPEIVNLASEQLKLAPTTEHPLDLNDRNPKKGVVAAKKMLTEAGITDLSDENIFIAATCQDKGIAFLNGKGELGVRKHTPTPLAQTAQTLRPATDNYTVSINGKSFAVQIKGQSAIINGKSYDVSVTDGVAEANGAISHKAAHSTAIKSPMHAKVIKILVAEGASIQAGQVICLLEAMKMEVEVSSPAAGTVSSIAISPGQQVKTGQLLATVN